MDVDKMESAGDDVEQVDDSAGDVPKKVEGGEVDDILQVDNTGGDVLSEIIEEASDASSEIKE